MTRYWQRWRMALRLWRVGHTWPEAWGKTAFLTRVDDDIHLGI